MEWHPSKSLSPIDFSQLPQLYKMKVEHYILRHITDSGLCQTRNFTLETLLHIFGINLPNASDTISVEVLDLGKIPVMLIELGPNHSNPHRDAALDLSSPQLANVPFPSDMSDWEPLDAALCTSRFAKLATLRMDYLIFYDRGPQHPDGHADIRGKHALPGEYWLSITKRIFPRTYAAGKIRLEGRIVAVDAPNSSYELVDYPKGVCVCQYP